MATEKQNNSLGKLLSNLRASFVEGLQYQTPKDNEAVLKVFDESITQALKNLADELMIVV